MKLEVIAEKLSNSQSLSKEELDEIIRQLFANDNEEWLEDEIGRLWAAFPETSSVDLKIPGMAQKILSDLKSRQLPRRRNEKIRVRRNRRRMFCATFSAVAAAVAFLIILFRPGSRDEVSEEKAASYIAVMHIGDGNKRYELGEVTDGTEWKIFAEQDTIIAGTNAAEVIITITVPRGGEYRLKLDDGTEIWLNADTEINYPKVFSGNRREVSISGEAYFEVATDPQIPFIVKLDGDRAVMVHGTQFNVQTYPGLDNICITLAEGAVTVETGLESIDLEPNQQAVIDRLTNKYMINDIPDARTYICWTEGLFFFKQTPIIDIINAMERWYDIDVVYDNINIRQLGNFTVKSDLRNDFKPMLDALSQVAGFRYTVEDRTVLLELPLNILDPNN